MLLFGGACFLIAPIKNRVINVLGEKNYMIYGYARVSSTDQNLERQLAEFESLASAKNKFIATKKAVKIFAGKVT